MDEPSALEVRHLRALVALAEEGTFTDAAIRLQRTQSGVSRTIAALERLAGVELVHRTTRSVALTAAGERAYRAAREALTAFDEVLPAARGAVRPLRLGYSWSALGAHTTDVLRRWRTQRPDVPLEVHRVDERDAGLARGRADVAVVRGALGALVAPGGGSPGLATQQVFREPRVAALPATHPLAGRAAVTLADLAGETVLVTAYGTTTPELWPAAQRPARSLRVDNTDEWLTEIAGGLAIGVTAESTAALHPHPGVAFVPLTDAEPIEVSLVWPSRRAHPAVTEFVAVVREVVAAAAPVPRQAVQQTT